MPYPRAQLRQQVDLNTNGTVVTVLMYFETAEMIFTPACVIINLT